MKMLSPCIRTFFFLVVLTGLVYPLALTLFGYLLMPHSSAGSLISDEQTLVGSILIGQQFKSPRYFWPRPSTSGYNSLHSGGSNLSPTSAELKELVETRAQRLSRYHPSAEPIPPDLLFASGSGLDPHISVAAAYYQAGRVADARHIDKERVYELIQSHIEKRFLGFLGETRVNVLLLNRALDNETHPQVHHD